MMKKMMVVLLLLLSIGIASVYAEPVPEASPSASPAVSASQTAAEPKATPVSSAEPVYTGNRVVSVLYTSDIHGNFQRSKESGVLGYSGIDAIRRSVPNSVLVDGGDYLTSNLFMAQNTVDNVLSLMNAAQYYLTGVGEADFENGISVLQEVQARAGFHMISSNVSFGKERKPLLGGTHIVEVEGIKLGFFSILNPDLRLSMNLDNLGDLYLEDASKIAQSSVNSLKEQGADIIIALSHMGKNENTTIDQIAAFVTGIDFIFDGHDHQEEQGRFIGDTLIMNPGANGKQLLQLELRFGETKTLTGFSTTIWSYQATENLEMNEEIVALENSIIEEQSAFLNERIATSRVDLPYADNIQYQSLALGNFIADSYRAKSMATIAMVDAGSIAAGIPRGNITKANILSVLPSGNTVQVKKITPKVLKGALENGLATLKLNADGTVDMSSSAAKFPQISGFTVDVNLKNEPGHRVIRIELDNGVSLNLTDDKTGVTIAANSGMFAGQNDYEILASKEVLEDYGSEGQALLDYLNTAGEYSDYTTERIELTNRQESHAGLLISALLIFIGILLVLVLVIKLMTRMV